VNVDGLSPGGPCEVSRPARARQHRALEGCSGERDGRLRYLGARFMNKETGGLWSPSVVHTCRRPTPAVLHMQHTKPPISKASNTGLKLELNHVNSFVRGARQGLTHALLPIRTVSPCTPLGEDL
jgi:hypothetical protein